MWLEIKPMRSRFESSRGYRPTGSEFGPSERERSKSAKRRERRKRSESRQRGLQESRSSSWTWQKKGAESEGGLQKSQKGAKGQRKGGGKKGKEKGIERKEERGVADWKGRWSKEEWDEWEAWKKAQEQEAGFDPTMQGSRGRRSRHSRQERRANDPHVLERARQYKQTGQWPEQVEKKEMKIGSQRWKRMKELEKETLEERRELAGKGWRSSSRR